MVRKAWGQGCTPHIGGGMPLTLVSRPSPSAGRDLRPARIAPAARRR